VGETAAASGPDFSQGVRAADIPREGTLAGRVGDEPVLLSRIEGELHAVGGACTHYGGALAKGLAEGGTVRCPLHHACFDLRTGKALHAPAFAPLDRWEVEQAGALVFVRGKAPAEPPIRIESPTTDVRAIVIVGGGAAGFACAERLRALGFDGKLTMLSAEADPPCDRPNLSKDFLAGTAPAEWIPLRDDAWYRDQAIGLRLGAEAAAIDSDRRIVTTRAGERFAFDRLLIATGSEPMRLTASQFAPDRVRTLRSLADARAIVALARPGARVAILGSSFIGLEAAAALRTRGLEVAIVSPDEVPFGSLFGREVGAFFQKLHERQGVAFHLGRIATAFDAPTLRLDDGHIVAADFVLAGIGVRPRTALAAEAGLEVSSGVHVDAQLETSRLGIYAAGDVALYPDPLSGSRVRVEHWVVAERQGQVAAANMLGARMRFDSVPFFWTEQYGTALRYVGHAAPWDEVRIEGSVEAGAFIARYHQAGVLRASAAVKMDQASLEDELLLERRIAAGSPENASRAGTPAAVGHPIREGAGGAGGFHRV
jgi:NADPH-dependent 2,4-dienoyl-CoA reductase/sulfur reductase-like enzyme/nitrite reductase/ring-hydroxylating ferredoxin subunit